MFSFAVLGVSALESCCNVLRLELTGEAYQSIANHAGNYRR